MAEPASRVVQVRVLEILPSGLRVQLVEGGRKGFVRKKEISWERRVSVAPGTPLVGEDRLAVILEDNGPDALLLSLRQAADPWENIQIKYGEVKTCEGEVVNVLHDEVYIQLEPGVDAVLFPEEAPLIPGQSLEDVLWLGDRVSVHALRIETKQRRIVASINHRLQELEIRKAQRQDILKAYFGADRHPSKEQASKSTGALYPFPKQQGEALNKLERMLIVEDDETTIYMLILSLSKEFKVPVDGAQTGSEAFEKLRQGNRYDLILIDNNLRNSETGIQLIEQIHQEYPQQRFLLISQLQIETDVEEEIARLGVLFCNKERQQIISTIHDLLEGQIRFPHAAQPELQPQTGYIQQLGMQALAQHEGKEVLQTILRTLFEQTNVSNCLVVKLDQMKHQAVIEAAIPELAPDVITAAQDNLYFSPVKQVIEDKHEYINNNASQNDPELKNLFGPPYFDSCLGIPILVPDQEPRYALFLLDKEPDGFCDGNDSGKRRLENAKVTAVLLSVALERETLLTFMDRYQAKYALGHLLGDMVHETKHKLSALLHDVELLKARVAIHPDWGNPERASFWLNGLVGDVSKIENNANEIKALIDSFDRQAKYKYEPVDVNEVVKKVARQLGTTANENNTVIQLDLATLPKAIGVSMQIEQVILNLVLNAIQMIGGYVENLRKAQGFIDLSSPLVQQGEIIIQTRCVWKQEDRSIEIRVIDSGPGIHRSEEEEIFLEDVSKRGGAGRGLSVSRNLIERMGGSLKLLNSIRYFGSAFSVMLPVLEEGSK